MTKPKSKAFFSRIGRKGGRNGSRASKVRAGHARALAMSPRRRREVARAAALARWAKPGCRTTKNGKHLRR